MSKTIIDTLVIELGLDASDLGSKAPRATRQIKQLEDNQVKLTKNQKEQTKATKESARAIGELSTIVGSFLAVIGGTMAIKSFVTDFISANAQLDRFSKNVGVNVQDVSAWEQAIEQFGGTAGGLQGTMDMLSRSQTELMLTGQSGLIPYFSALGLSLADVGGKARPVDQILLDLSGRLSKLPRNEANNIGRMMGIDQGTLNVLLQGREQLELLISRQKQSTAVTKEQAAEAQKLQIRLAQTRQEFNAEGRALLMEFAPMIEKALDVLMKLGDWVAANREFIADFLKVLGVGLAAIAIASAPINLTVAAIVALAAAIALLWQDYQVWKHGGDSLIDWGKWKPAIDAATTAIQILEGAINKAFDAWQKFYKVISSGQDFKKNFAEGIDAIKEFVGVRPEGAQTRKGNQSTIQRFFESQGWTPQQAAGITANLMRESQGNTNAVGDHGQAFGLAQWHPDRQAAFRQWSGHDIRSSTLAEQLAFVQFELTQGQFKGAGTALRNTQSAYAAGSVVSRLYERPAQTEQEAGLRGNAAASLLAGQPGAASTLAQTASGPGVTPAPANAAGPTSVDRSVQTSIGTINVQTQAADAQGIVNDISNAMDYLHVSQANGGMN